MNIRRLNWPVWIGFVLSLFAFLSYYFIFIWFPTTRDFPWANLLLFVVSSILLLYGLRRAFVKERPLRSKIGGTILTVLGLLVFVFFTLNFFVFGKFLPASEGAPRVGQKAPDFTLPDTNNKPVTLTELLSSPINGKAPRGVLLIFYRGYW